MIGEIISGLYTGLGLAKREQSNGPEERENLCTQDKNL